MTTDDAFDKMVEDIEYYYYLDNDDNDLIEFAETSKYTNIDDLHKHLGLLTTIDKDEVYQNA